MMNVEKLRLIFMNTVIDFYESIIKAVGCIRGSAFPLLYCVRDFSHADIYGHVYESQ